MSKILCLSVVIALLTGCAAATPLLLVEAGGHHLARQDEDSKVQAAAALAEEPDLITFSVQAISQNKTEQAVAVYLKGYNNPDYSPQMKSMAIYQIALVYMNRYNDQMDEQKAAAFFNRHLKEFPQSPLRGRIEQRLAILEKRQQDPIKLSPAQLIKQVDRAELLKKDNTPYDSELTPMSERAISENRINDAEQLYLVLYNNKASSDEMRAKALYQIGLIYMSPYNEYNDNKKALEYFQQIKREFPNSSAASSSTARINQLLNRQ